jgi:hypothetical protein
MYTGALALVAISTANAFQFHAAPTQASATRPAFATFASKRRTRPEALHPRSVYVCPVPILAVKWRQVRAPLGKIPTKSSDLASCLSSALP